MTLEQALGTAVDAGLQTPASSLQPPTPTNPRLTEALLFRLWAGQRFPESALVTAQGTPLRVLQPGRAGRGAGPDFRDAIIAPPSGPLLRGDVELHVRAADFAAHGHAGDARYNGVVLHVVFAGGGRAETTLASGRRVPIVALSPWLERRAQEIEGWLQRPTLWREPCHDAVARLGRDAVISFLEERSATNASRMREEALASLIESLGPGEALYRALLDSVAYGGHSSLAGRAESLPYAELQDSLDAEAGAGRAALAEHLLVSRLQPQPWRTAVRPANRPERRLAGLARLLARHHPLEPLRGRTFPTPSRERSSRAGRRRHTSAARARSSCSPTPSCPGRRRAPPGWNRIEDAADARSAFAALPRPATTARSRSWRRNLRDGGRPLPLTARRQQGLLALYKSECSRGGCGRCHLS